MDDEQRKILIIAGPNGAGKSTFANEYLPHEAGCPTFINADLIAAGLSPFEPDKAALRAGRLMLEEIEHHVNAKHNFALETTLSGRSYARMIPQWQAANYSVHLIFLKLESPELAVERVAVRVRQGGHAIPEDVIRRRFAKGWENFQNLYQKLVDSWRLYDNSTEQLVFIAESEIHD